MKAWMSKGDCVLGLMTVCVVTSPRDSDCETCVVIGG